LRRTYEQRLEEGGWGQLRPFEFKMLSIIGGRAKIIDMRKKSCTYVGLRKFKDTVSYRRHAPWAITASGGF
jgi:hypothetical protein